jgi:hypothetical protein
MGETNDSRRRPVYVRIPVIPDGYTVTRLPEGTIVEEQGQMLTFRSAVDVIPFVGAVNKLNRTVGTRLRVHKRGTEETLEVIIGHVKETCTRTPAIVSCQRKPREVDEALLIRKVCGEADGEEPEGSK